MFQDSLLYSYFTNNYKKFGYKKKNYIINMAKAN